MKNLKTLIITLTFLSLESYAGWFSPEIVICDQTDQVQKRGGVIYLPNQSDGFSGLNSCIWTKNEQQASLGNYSDGLKDGKWTTWYENGQKKLEENYEDGKLDGKHTQWYENGQTKYKVNYEDGKRDGKGTVWWSNGRIFQGDYVIPQHNVFRLLL